MARKLPGRAIQAGSISTTQLDNTVTTVISQGGGPKITNIQVTNNTYTVLDDTAVDTAGGYIRITGTGFAAGCQVLVNNIPATSTTFVSATEVRAQVPATAAGTYVVYLVNTDGGVAIRVNGITFSATPTWVTGGALSGANNVAISIQLSATLAATYALAAGSTLPTGLTLTSGGLLSGTITGLTQETVYSFTIVATDSENQDSPRTFTLTITAGDPYYELVTLHLPGTANTFIKDASTNNFALTPSGDVRSAKFSPFNTGWGAYFNGSNYLQTPSSTSFAFGTGDFTVEGWFFSNDTTVGARLFYFSDNADNVGINYNSTGTIAYYNGSTNAVSGTTPFVRNQWNHVAVVRSSGTVTIYVNGTSAVTQSTPYNSSTARTISIPTTSFGGGIIGYISNIRIVKGVAVYTSNFTPPTSPLTATQSAGLVGSNIQAITGTQTSLLTCQSNRFVDNSVANSGTGFTLTVSGSPSVQAFSPFAETDTSTGSGYFDGSGDYLSFPVNSAFTLGTNNFTIEGWLYPNTLVSDVSTAFVLDSNAYPRVMWYYTGGVFTVHASTTGSGWDITHTCSVVINQWNHLVLQRNGNDFRTFLNGSLVATTTASLNLPAQRSVGYVGRGDGGSQIWNGYISNLRIVNGTAIYNTSGFTPPTAPVTAVANTQLLTLQNRTNYNNSGFEDSSQFNHVITRSGNATQGTFSPFSQTGWGNYFNGSSYLSIAANAAFNYGSGNFTIEAWVNLSSTSSNFQIYASTTGGYSSPEFIWLYNSTTGLRLYAHTGTYDINQGSISGWSARTWYHVALVRNGTTVTLYKDGVSVASGSVSTASFGSSTSTQAIAASVSEATYATGYISNLRVVKGVAVYTGNFTVPTSALTATQSAGTNIQAITTGQTSLLTCQSNRFVDNGQGNTGNTGFTITVNGSPSVQAFSPFNPTASWSAAAYGGSGYFDGSGDYLTVPQSAGALDLGSGQFSLEFWWYPTSAATSQYPFIGESNGDWYVGVENNNMGLGRRAVTVDVNTTGFTLTANTWQHFVIARQSTGSNDTRIFVNGVLRGVGTTSQNYTIATTLRIGGQTGGSINGYLSSINLVKGSVPAAYQTSSTTTGTQIFAPPTSPSTSVTGTQLLLNFTNAGIYDTTGRNDLETVGNAQISTAQSKWGGSSMAFDGTGDYLKSNYASSDLPAFGSGDFTIEMWIRFTNAATSLVQNFMDFRPGGGNQIAPMFYILNSTIRFYVNGFDRITSSSVSSNQWYHLAVSRSGSSTKMFIDGVQTGSTYTDSNVYISGAAYPYIGISRNGGDDFNGYLQDIRVTKGYARYTANFTPPTAAFQTL